MKKRICLQKKLVHYFRNIEWRHFWYVHFASERQIQIVIRSNSILGP